MKVYVIMDYGWEYGEVLHVSSTREKARQWILNEFDFDVDAEERFSVDDSIYNGDPAFIEEWEVD
jgi:hypothetical protein